MQIGNNRPNGPQPHDRKNAKLDPDLTKSNREGIEKASNQGREATSRAIEERSPARNAESLKARDTFERSKPQDDAGPSVEERLKNARMQGREARAERIENARGQRADRIDNARVQNTEARMGARIAGARDKNAKAVEGSSESLRKPAATPERIENARGQRADRIDNARVQNTDARAAERVAGARQKNAEVETPSRLESARTQAAEAQAERIENARDQRTRVENASSADGASLSRESVAFSDSVASLAASELPGVGGSQESNDARAERVALLREAFKSGELMSTERLRNAAARLLGGE